MFEIAEGPLNTRIYLQAGRPDFENRYTSTVMITTKEPLDVAASRADLAVIRSTQKARSRQ